MYTPELIYITVLAHACAWEEMINCATGKTPTILVQLVTATRT